MRAWVPCSNPYSYTYIPYIQPWHKHKLLPSLNHSFPHSLPPSLTPSLTHATVFDVWPFISKRGKPRTWLASFSWILRRMSKKGMFKWGRLGILSFGYASSKSLIFKSWKDAVHSTFVYLASRKDNSDKSEINEVSTSDYFLTLAPFQPLTFQVEKSSLRYWIKSKSATIWVCFIPPAAAHLIQTERIGSMCVLPCAFNVECGRKWGYNHNGVQGHSYRVSVIGSPLEHPYRVRCSQDAHIAQFWCSQVQSISISMCCMWYLDILRTFIVSVCYTTRTNSLSICRCKSSRFFFEKPIPYCTGHPRPFGTITFKFRRNYFPLAFVKH